MGAEIILPPNLREKIERIASRRGVSVQEFVNDALEKALEGNREDDPLFSDKAVFHGDAPTDMATNHDSYLYPETP